MEQASSLPRARDCFPPLAISWAAARLAQAALVQRVGFPPMTYSEVMKDEGLKQWRSNLLALLRSGEELRGLPVTRCIVVVLSSDGKRVILQNHDNKGFAMRPNLPVQYRSRHGLLGAVNLCDETIVESASSAVRGMLQEGLEPRFEFADDGRTFGAIGACEARYLGTVVFSAFLKNESIPGLAPLLRKSQREWVTVAHLETAYKPVADESMRYIRCVLAKYGLAASATVDAKQTEFLAAQAMVVSKVHNVVAFLGFGEVPEPVSKLKSNRTPEADSAWCPEVMGSLHTGDAPAAPTLSAQAFSALRIESVEEQTAKYLEACSKYLTGDRLDEALKVERGKDGEETEEEERQKDLTSRSGQLDRVAVLLPVHKGRILCHYSQDGLTTFFSEALMPLTGGAYKDWLLKNQNYKRDVQRAKKKKQPVDDILKGKTAMERFYLQEPFEKAHAALARGLEPWFADRECGAWIREALVSATAVEPESALRFFAAVNEFGRLQKPGAPAKAVKYMVWVLSIPDDVSLERALVDQSYLRVHTGDVMRVLLPSSSERVPTEFDAASLAPDPVVCAKRDDPSQTPLHALVSMEAEQFLEELGRAEPRAAVASRCALHVHAPSLSVAKSGTAEAFFSAAEHAYEQVHGVDSEGFIDERASEGFADILSVDRVAHECFYETAVDLSDRTYCILRVGSEVYDLIKRRKKTWETRLLKGLHSHVTPRNVLGFVAEEGQPVLWSECVAVMRVRDHKEAVAKLGDAVYPDAAEMYPEEIDRVFFEIHSKSMSRREWDDFHSRPGPRVVCWELKLIEGDTLMPAGRTELGHVEAARRIRGLKKENELSIQGHYKPGDGAYRLARLTRSLLSVLYPYRDAQSRSLLALQCAARCLLARNERRRLRSRVLRGLALRRSLKVRRWLRASRDTAAGALGALIASGLDAFRAQRDKEPLPFPSEKSDAAASVQPLGGGSES